MKLSDLQKISLESRAAAYESQLNERASPISLAGCEYLASRLLLHDVWESDPFRFGVVAEPLPGDEQYQGRLCIPYLTLAGVRGLKFRCIEDHDCKESGHAKYIQPFGQEQRIYNALAYFGAHDAVGIAEGELDAVTATIHLGIPTVGIPGATQWDKSGWHWQLVLRDFAQVVIFADGDKAGKEFAQKVANDAGPSSRIAWCPDGEDVNSMVVKGRADELKRKAGI